MITSADIDAALRQHLSPDLYGAIPALAQVLADAAIGTMRPVEAQARLASPDLARALQALAGQQVADSSVLITFGAGSQLGNVMISGNVAGGSVVKLSVSIGTLQNVTVQDNATVGSIIGTQHNFYTAPSAADRERALRALLHDHSGFIASRMEAFVGREAELAEIRQRIAEKLPTGGYVTITGQAGQGKTSVIAKLVADAIGGEAALREKLEQPEVGVPICHFIPFSPGPDHQVGLLRNLIARLCLTYNLPDLYATAESRPALRDYFATVLRDLAKAGRQEIIYIDGLDQIEEDSSGVRDLSFLPEEPPVGIVFVLGTRPNDTLKPLELRKPQHEYWLPALSRADFNLILTHRKVQLDTALADRFYVAMQENALYLDLVAHELAQTDVIEPEQIIARVADNPANLFTLSIERFQRNERQWEGVLQPILGLLLAARTPLSRHALRSLIGVIDLRVRQGLERLGGLIQRDGEGRYGLFHLKLGEHLRQDVFAADEEVDYHQQLVDWCEGGKGGINAIWADASGDALEQERRVYARKHYIAHMAAARSYARLWELIDRGDYGTKKRHHDPSMRSYVLDLDIARQVIVDLGVDDAHTRARYLPQLWKYSLLRCTLASRADSYPEELFVALVALGRSSEAINLAELLSDPVKKTNVLRDISVTMIARNEPSGRPVLLRARVIADAIPDDPYGGRARALSSLAGVLAQAGMAKAAESAFEAAAAAIGAMPGSDHARVNALCTLALALALAGRQRQAEATFEDARRAADRLPLRGDWLPLTDAHANEQTRKTLAISLIEAGRWDAARAAADALGSNTPSDSHALVLIALAAALARAGHPEAEATFATARTAAESLPYPDSRAQALIALGTAFAQAGKPADADFAFIGARIAALDVPDNPMEHTSPEHALTDLVIAQAQAGQWEAAQALAATLSMTARSQALAALVIAQAQAGQWEAADETRPERLAELNMSAQTLSRLAMILAEAGDERGATLALAAARDTAVIGHGWYLARIDSAMEALALSLVQAGQWESVPDVVKTYVLSAPDHTRVRLAQALLQIDDWDAARAIIDGITDLDMHADSLMVLAQALARAGKTDAALTTLADVRGIADRLSREAGSGAPTPFNRLQNQEQILAKLAVALAESGQWDDARATINAISNAPYMREQVLRTLARAAIKAGRWEDARAFADSITEAFERIQLLGDLAVALNLAQQPEAATAIIELAQDVCNKIAALPHNLHLHSQALQALSSVMAQIGQWEAARATADKIDETSSRIMALVDLASAQTRAGNDAAARATAAMAMSLVQLPKNAQGDLEPPRQSAAAADIHAASEHLNSREAQTPVSRYRRSQVLEALTKNLVQAGQWDCARAMIDSIDAADRAPALIELGQALALGGQRSAARAIFAEARAIAIDMLENGRTYGSGYSFGGRYEPVLVSLIQAQAAVAHWEEAQTTLAAIPDNLMLRYQAEQALFQALINAGQWEMARRMIDPMPERIAIQSLVMLANALGREGQDAAVAAALSDAHALADHLPPDTDSLFMRSEALIDIVRGHIQLGQWDAARATIGSIPTARGFHSQALSTLSNAQAQAGLWDDARATIDSLPNDNYRSSSLSALAQAQAQAGRWDAARTTIEAIDIWDRTPALSDLAQAQARAGLLRESYATIEAIISVWNRDPALSALAQAQAQAGRWDDARATINSIRDDRSRDQILNELIQAQIQALAQAGQWDAARATIDSLPNDYSRAQSLVQTGQWDAARATIDSFPEDFHRDQILDELAQAQAQAGRWDAARTTIDSIADSGQRSQGLGSLGLALAKAGLAEAAAAFDDARRIAETLAPDPDNSVFAGMAFPNPNPDQALASLAHLQAIVGEHEAARASIGMIADVVLRDRTRDKLAQAQVAAREYEAAGATIKAIASEQRAPALIALAKALALDGQRSAAAAIFADVYAIVDTLAHNPVDVTPGFYGAFGSMRAQILASLAQAQAAIGEWQAAAVSADMIAEPDRRSEVLAALAQAQIAAGDWRAARATIDSIPQAWARSYQLAILADALMSTGQQERARATATTCIESYAQIGQDVSFPYHPLLTTRLFPLLANTFNSMPGAISPWENQQLESDSAFKKYGPLATDRISLACRLAQILAQSGLLPQSTTLLTDLWRRAQTRDELLHLFVIDAALLRAYPELGREFLDSFAWVDAQLAAG